MNGRESMSIINQSINYSSIIHAIKKGFLSDKNIEFYKYFQNKIEQIDVNNISLIDKIFVLTSKYRSVSSAHRHLMKDYDILISEKDFVDVIRNYQCYDLEITLISKLYFHFQFCNDSSVNSQIDYIIEHGQINLPNNMD